MPRRGWSGAQVWPDTSVLLSIARKDRMIARFAARFAGRTHVVAAVDVEVTRLADRPTALLRPEQVAATGAAMKIRPRLRSGELPVVPAAPPADDAEIALADAALTALRAGPRENADQDHALKHAGEAAVIVACVRASAAGRDPQLMLANDGHASHVAARHNILTRHAADVIAEFACADQSLDPAELLDDFQFACGASKPPDDCCPADAEAFTCARGADGCPLCPGAPPTP